MKIQRLFLRNVRNIKELDLDFRDPVTGKPMSRIVLAGANGSGKTTILECLYGLIATAGKFLTAETAFYDKLQDTDIVLATASSLQAFVELEFSAERVESLSLFYGVSKETMVEDSGISESVWVGGRMRQQGSLWGPGDESLQMRLARSIQRGAKHEEEAVDSVLFFPYNRNLPAVKQSQIQEERKTYQWAYRYKATNKWKGSPESYLVWLNLLDLEDYRDRNKEANRFSQAVELINSILVGKRIARVRDGKVIVETEKGESHGLGDLSSGEKQIVLLIIEILRRIIPGSVILIDEPEISLHSAWQRGLVVALDKIIEQYDAQVILATHSLEIASMVLPHEVLFLSDLNVPLGKWNPENEVIA
jgi:ABC-type lipoprotein export system ATPase subunit